MPSNRTGRSRRSAVALAVAAAFLLTACPNDAPPPVEEPPGENAITPDDEDDPAADAEVTLELVAENTQFDQDTLTVPAGAQVALEFDNRDTVGHNFALYESDAADEVIFQGEIVTGTTVTYEFTAPDEPGTYYFQCDPHSQVMNGEFVVEG